MNRFSRAQREAREDPLWAAVWQLWPTAMTLEEETPFDAHRRPFQFRKRAPARLKG